MKSTIGYKDLIVKIERKKIKNLYLKVKRSTGEILVSAPVYMKDEKIIRFIHEKEDWIRRKRNKLKDKRIIERINLDNLDCLYLFGDKIRINIKYVDKNPLYLKKEGNILILYIKKDTSKKKQKEIIREWYRDRLMEKIDPFIEKWERIMDIEVNEFRTKRMKTRWGTCNISKKRIWINLELVKIPKKYLEYVIVHEMTHLFERGHGERFKSLMDSYFPNWRIMDEELRGYIIEK